MSFLHCVFKQLKHKKPGNSLTFLLGSITIISLSLTMTTMVGNSLTGKESLQKSNIDGIKIVAEHHLDRLEKYVRNTPVTFLNPNSWDPTVGASTTLPAYQPLKAASLNTLSSVTVTLPNPPAGTPSTTNLKTYAEVVKLPSGMNEIDLDTQTGTNPVGTTTVTSTLNSIYRLSDAPYTNTLVLNVSITSGAYTRTFSRQVSVAPNTCAIDQASTPSWYELPYIANEPGNFRVNSMQNEIGVNHLIENTDPYIQFWASTICQLPDRNANSGALPNCFLQGTYPNYPSTGVAKYAYMIYGKHFVEQNGKEVWVRLISIDYTDGNGITTPSTIGNFQNRKIRLEVTTKLSGTTSSASQEAFIPLPRGGRPESIGVDLFKPVNGDATKTYTLPIIFLDEQDGRLKMTFAKFQTATTTPVILTGSGNGVFTNPNTVYGYDPGSVEVFPTSDTDGLLSPNDSFAYHPTSKTIVATGIRTGVNVVDSTNSYQIRRGNRRVVGRKLVAPVSATAAPTFTSIIASTLPDATNEARGLFNPNYVVFGKPVISSDGNFALIPTAILQDTSGAGASDNGAYLRVFAFNMSNSGNNKINGNNAIDTSTGSNLVTLMKFSGDAASMDQKNSQAGLRATSLINFNAFYNPTNNKFYWLLRQIDNPGEAPDSDEVIFEWDPTTWGVGGTTTTWISAASQSQNMVKKNIKLLGTDTASGVTDKSYTGQYWTVRMIRNASGQALTPIWSADPATGGAIGLSYSPQVIFNKYTNDFFLLNLNTATTPWTGNFFRINPEKGYQKIFSAPMTIGQGLAYDSKTGTIYFSTLGADSPDTIAEINGTGLYAYNIFNGKTTKLLTSLSGGETAFSDTAWNSGDGSIFYSRDTETLFFLDIPGSSSTRGAWTGLQGGQRPRLYAYRPYCYNNSSSTATMPGTQSYAGAFSDWTEQTESMGMVGLQGTLGNQGPSGAMGTFGE